MSYETVLNGKISGSTGSGSGSSSILSIDEACYAAWMDAYKTYGENSYVYNRKDVWKALLESPLAINDPATSELALDWALEQGGHAGKIIGSMSGMSQTPDWSSLSTLQEICNNESACNAVMNHSVASDMIFRFNNYEIMDYHSIYVYRNINKKKDYITELINSTKYKDSKTTKTSTYDGYAILCSFTNNIGSNKTKYWTQGGNSDFFYYTVHAYGVTGLQYDYCGQISECSSNQSKGAERDAYSYYRYGTLSQPYSIQTNTTINGIVNKVTPLHINNVKVVDDFVNAEHKRYYTNMDKVGQDYTNYIYEYPYTYLTVTGGSYVIIPL